MSDRDMVDLRTPPITVGQLHSYLQSKHWYEDGKNPERRHYLASFKR